MSVPSPTRTSEFDLGLGDALHPSRSSVVTEAGICLWSAIRGESVSKVNTFRQHLMCENCGDCWKRPANVDALSVVVMLEKVGRDLSRSYKLR